MAIIALGTALAGTLGVVVAAVAGGAVTGAELMPDLRQEPPSQIAVRRDDGRPVLVFRSARRSDPGHAVARAGSGLATGLTVLAGTALWVLFLWGGLHARWIGVDPLGHLGA